MRVTLDWLRDFVELDGDTGQIAADLTTAGLEVEAVDAFGAGENEQNAWELHGETRYRLPMRLLLGWDLVSPLVGIAQGCIDDFISRIRAQTGGARGYCTKEC